MEQAIWQRLQFHIAGKCMEGYRVGMVKYVMNELQVGVALFVRNILINGAHCSNHLFVSYDSWGWTYPRIMFGKVTN